MATAQIMPYAAMTGEESRAEAAGKPARSLAVAIVTYNSGSVLPDLLASLPAGLAGIEHVQVFVVDNDSSDGSADIAERHACRPQVIRTGRNGGYAAGINAAAGAADANSDLLVLNPDIRLLPGAGGVLLDRLAADASIGVVAPQILGTDGHIARSLRREPSLATAWCDALLGGTLAGRLGLGEIVADPAVYARAGTVEWATGAVLMVSAWASRLVGSWDESFFLYSEEVDYLRRVREFGLSVEYVPEAKVVHIGGDYQSSPHLSGLMAANRIRDYGRRHGRARSQVFRMGIVVGEAMRAGLGPSHRAALRAALAADRS